MRLSLFHSSFVSLAFLALGTLALGCNYAQLKAAPDAAPSCQGASILEYPCVAGATGAAGCTGDLQSSAALGTDVILDGGSYPVGCGVIVNASVTDQDNQCTQIGTCHCQESDAGAYSWFCAN